MSLGLIVSAAAEQPEHIVLGQLNIQQAMIGKKYPRRNSERTQSGHTSRHAESVCTAGICAPMSRLCEAMHLLFEMQE